MCNWRALLIMFSPVPCTTSVMLHVLSCSTSCWGTVFSVNTKNLNEYRDDDRVSLSCSRYVFLGKGEKGWNISMYLYIVIYIGIVYLYR